MEKQCVELPAGTNIHKLWEVYQKHINFLKELASTANNNDLDEHSRFRYMQTMLNKELGMYRIQDMIPLNEYCHITGISYNSLMQRIYNKCLIPEEAIEYGRKKLEKKKERELYAKHIKQYQHMLAIIDHLVSDVISSPDETTC